MSEGFLRVPGWCLKGAWMVSEGFLYGVCGGVNSGLLKMGQFKSEQVKSEYPPYKQVKSEYRPYKQVKLE